jgi:hypothetical protein
MAHLNGSDNGRPLSPEEFAAWKADRRTQRQKNWSLAGLSTITVAILVMWFLQFRQNITAPLYRQLGLSNNQEIATALKGQTINQKEQQDEALKLLDTDGDGLSDYDELYIYNTSPFLEDSDSDGVSDKIEIERGQDPNCPIGKDCSGSILVNPAATIDTAPEVISAVADSISQPVILPDNTGDLTADSILPTDVNSLRQVLLQAGMDQSMLDQFSDDDLLQAYQEAFR